MRYAATVSTRHYIAGCVVSAIQEQPDPVMFMIMGTGRGSISAQVQIKGRPDEEHGLGERLSVVNNHGAQVVLAARVVSVNAFLI